MTEGFRVHLQRVLGGVRRMYLSYLTTNGKMRDRDKSGEKEGNRSAGRVQALYP
ncbi:MAG: hypothetical protein V3V46_03840 [Anaerolineales bacterium]